MTRGLTFVVALGLFLGTGALLRRWVPEYLVYQPSTSLAKGWYGRALTARPLQVGDLVYLDVPDSMRPYMPPEVPQARLLKQIAGLAGDTVCWTPEGMHIHGRHYAYAEGMRTPHPHLGCGTIGEHEMVVVGTHARSFDSRYVGCVPRHFIRWRAVPLWTWKAP